MIALVPEVTRDERCSRFHRRMQPPESDNAQEDSERISILQE